MFVARLLLLAALLGVWCGAAGQSLEQQVKAAFLFRFLHFVEWPAAAMGAPGAPWVIAVLGADALHAELEKTVAGRTVHDRPVVVERLRDGEPPGRAHMLFVGRGVAAAQLRRHAMAPALLLVAEAEGALEQGALINFVIQDDRVRFEVAPDEAERRGLRIGARVLAVALHVKPGPARL